MLEWTRSTIAIFGSADCPFTRRALQSYKSQIGVDVIFHDVTSEPKSLVAMLKTTAGRTEIPVIIQDGKMTVGFGGSRDILVH